mgnify:CR=1 FL=1
MEKQPTPIRELIEWCIKNAFNVESQDGIKYVAIDYEEMRKEFDALLKKEKQVITEAYRNGFLSDDIKLASEYYNENFKTK